MMIVTLCHVSNFSYIGVTVRATVAEEIDTNDGEDQLWIVLRSSSYISGAKTIKVRITIALPYY